MTTRCYTHDVGGGAASRSLAPARFALALLAVGACSDAAPTTSAVGAEALFIIPASLEELSGEAFFTHPFPSDLRREDDGTARFVGWPNPNDNVIVSQYVSATAHLLAGFSPAAPIYVRFSAPLDVDSLPKDPPAALNPQATVQLIDVDPSSNERGQRRLITWHFQETVAEGSYFQPNTLAVMPILGRPLRPSTRYALIVTRRAKAKDGGALAPSADLAEVLGTSTATSRTERARALFTPTLEALSAEIARGDIAHMTVFTTNDPSAEVFAIADHVKADVASPTARDLAKRESTADYDVYEGSYGPSPDYQAGAPPFRAPADGGGFAFEAGAPKLQRTFDLRFALAVPNQGKCPQPTSGYPIVLYAHGTGGDYRSFLDDRTAEALAQECLASIGVDQIFHGTRPGAPDPSDPQRDTKVQLLFFNFDNPIAARTNNRQSAIDVVQEARLFTESKVVVPANVSATGASISFDANKVLFFGHSQGGLNGPLFLAASDAARGGVLSGAGSVLGVALLEKSKPVDVGALVRVLLGMTDEARARELSLFHPAIAITQSLVDATDPVHYGARITTSPRAGFAPKSVYQTEGIAADGSGDTYAPPHGIEALALSMSLPRVAPGTHPLVEAGWAKLGDVVVPDVGISGNLGGGRATGALAQFVPKAGSDGHFVVFNVPAARAQAASFCRDLAADPIGRLRP